MNEKYPDYVKQDYSVRMQFGEEEELVDRVWDHVHLFRPLGHSIVKLVTEEGMAMWHMPIEQGEAVAEAAGITPIDRPDITVKEYLAYRRYQESVLDDSWLNDDR